MVENVHQELNIEHQGDSSQQNTSQDIAPQEISRPRTSHFIYEYLTVHGQAYIAEIHRAYKQKYKEQKYLVGAKSTNYKETGRTRTIAGHAHHMPTYHSFAVQISKLIIAGLLETVAFGGNTPSGNIPIRTDPRSSNLTHPNLLYIKLSAKGQQASKHIWNNPLGIWYNPKDWMLTSPEYRDYIRPEKLGEIYSG